MQNSYVEVALPLAIRSNLTYQIPEILLSKCAVGCRVWVPVNNEFVIGIVVGISSDKPAFETKSIREVLDDSPIIDQKSIALFSWMSQYYLCSMGEVIQAALPNGMNFISKGFVVLGGKKPAKTKSHEAELLDFLESGAEVTIDEICRRWPEFDKAKLRNLAKQEVVSIFYRPFLKTTESTEVWWKWNTEVPRNYEQKKLPKWKSVAKNIDDANILPAPFDAIKSEFGITAHVKNKLEKEAWISTFDRPKSRQITNLEYHPESINSLNEDQQAAFLQIKDKIDNNQYALFLLNGITGSGKTEVYIHALRHVLERGEGGLVLVPEIALTPQTVRRFYRIFGDDIAVLHSRLTQKERLDEWNSIKRGEKSVVIGARSAVFAPIQNLGIIIIDEEHDSSYKQSDPSPRYHAREVAIMRAFERNIPVVAGSATPSLNLLGLVEQGKANVLYLKNRHGNANLPHVAIVDLKQYRSAMFGPLSAALYHKTGEILDKGEQAIFLLNRRGFSSYASCASCGHTKECPNCSVSLTYHKKQHHLRCHYCGYSTRTSIPCVKCNSQEVELPGTGTQKVELELHEIFPDARILRMDQDTTSGKDAHAEILGKFGRGEADILVGTQIVAKGLDFPNVTLVGVLNADTEASFPSYRSGERMYQLLNQVAGRAGRAEKSGVVIFQTRDTTQIPLIQASKHDFEGFARHEMMRRKEHLYPPYSKLLKLEFKDRLYERSQQMAQNYGIVARKILDPNLVLGPAQALIARKSLYWFWELYIKLPKHFGAPQISAFVAQLEDALTEDMKKGLSSVRVNISIDPMD